MRIVAEQRYVKKEDGRKYLQCRYYTNLYVGDSRALGMDQATLTDWEDVPLCLDDWPEDGSKGERV